MSASTSRRNFTPVADFSLPLAIFWINGRCMTFLSMRLRLLAKCNFYVLVIDTYAYGSYLFMWECNEQVPGGRLSIDRCYAVGMTLVETPLASGQAFVIKSLNGDTYKYPFSSTRSFKLIAVLPEASCWYGFASPQRNERNQFKAEYNCTASGTGLNNYGVQHVLRPKQILWTIS